MEEKYNAERVLRHVWGKFFKIGENESQYSWFKVFIEIKNSKKCFLISAPRNEFQCLQKGYCYGNIWTKMKNTDLEKNKDSFGKVHIKYKDEPIEISGKTIGPFESYDEFWEFINK